MNIVPQFKSKIYYYLTLIKSTLRVHITVQAYIKFIQTTHNTIEGTDDTSIHPLNKFL